MKYKEGNIVLLNNDKAVSILAINEETQEYQVIDTDDETETYSIPESFINMLIT